jgi:hypothetical protein
MTPATRGGLHNNLQHLQPTIGVSRVPTLPTGWSRETISHLAEKFAQAVGLKPGGEVSPIVERLLNGRIVYLDWQDWKAKGADTIDVRGPGDFTIYLSKIGGLLNNRFSIAHELGHYVLHSKLGKFPLIAQNNGEDEAAEWEADCFAAALLMPPKEFRRLWQRQPNGRIMASKFLVPPDVAELWSETLNLDRS